MTEPLSRDHTGAGLGCPEQTTSLPSPPCPRRDGVPLNAELRDADAHADYAITWSATRLP